VELVEPGYAMVDQAPWYGKVCPGVLDVMVMPYHSESRNTGATGLVQCTPVISVSSVTLGNYHLRENWDQSTSSYCIPREGKAELRSGLQINRL
jgi:hypothetical protein